MRRRLGDPGILTRAKARGAGHRSAPPCATAPLLTLAIASHAHTPKLVKGIPRKRLLVLCSLCRTAQKRHKVQISGGISGILSLSREIVSCTLKKEQLPESETAKPPNKGARGAVCPPFASCHFSTCRLQRGPWFMARTRTRTPTHARARTHTRTHNTLAPGHPHSPPRAHTQLL